MFAMLLRSKWFARATLVPLIFWGIPTACAEDDTQRLTAAYNAAGIDIFGQLERAPGNIGISPYSIGTAMAMALSGARGETAAEMAKFSSTSWITRGLKRQMPVCGRSSMAMTQARPAQLR